MDAGFHSTQSHLTLLIKVFGKDIAVVAPCVCFYLFQPQLRLQNIDVILSLLSAFHEAVVDHFDGNTHVHEEESNTVEHTVLIFLYCKQFLVLF